MNTRKQQQGFTIIEVVLVLAIAALIFLMVFIALPALQRNQRDTARKNDASAVAAALNNYRSQNRGSFTGLDSAELQKYIDRLDQYEKTGVTVSTGTLNPAKETIVVRTGVKCPTGVAPAATFNVTGASGTARTAAVSVALENNGDANNLVFYCVDV